MNDYEEMPGGVKNYNGSNEPCDMLVGLCCCGAFHRKTDWVYKDGLIVGYDPK